jgi:hypothetical protein
MLALGAALVVVLVLTGEMLNTRATFIAVAGVPVLLMARRYGFMRGGLPVYMIAGLIALPVTPVGALLFGGVFGLYALIKNSLERLEKRRSWIAKIIYFGAIATAGMLFAGVLTERLNLPEWLASWGWLAIPPLAAAFIVYDIALDRMVRIIERRI